MRGPTAKVKPVKAVEQFIAGRDDKAEERIMLTWRPTVMLATRLRNYVAESKTIVGGRSTGPSLQEVIDHAVSKYLDSMEK